MKKVQDSQKIASLLLDYLQTTNQSSLSPDIIKGLEETASDESDSNAVVVTTALSLDSSDKKILEKFVKQTLRDYSRIDYKLNSSLIAGFTLKLGDNFIDASLQTKLNKLKDHLSFT